MTLDDENEDILLQIQEEQRQFPPDRHGTLKDKQLQVSQHVSKEQCVSCCVTIGTDDNK